MHSEGKLIAAVSPRPYRPVWLPTKFITQKTFLLGEVRLQREDRIKREGGDTDRHPGLSKDLKFPELSTSSPQQVAQALPLAGAVRGSSLGVGVRGSRGRGGEAPLGVGGGDSLKSFLAWSSSLQGLFVLVAA